MNGNDCGKNFDEFFIEQWSIQSLPRFRVTHCQRIGVSRQFTGGESLIKLQLCGVHRKRQTIAIIANFMHIVY